MGQGVDARIERDELDASAVHAVAHDAAEPARLLGTVPSVVFGGTMTLAVVAFTTWRAPALRRLGPLAP